MIINPRASRVKKVMIFSSSLVFPLVPRLCPGTRLKPADHVPRLPGVGRGPGEDGWFPAYAGNAELNMRQYLPYPELSKLKEIVHRGP